MMNETDKIDAETVAEKTGGAAAAVRFGETCAVAAGLLSQDRTVLPALYLFLLLPQLLGLLGLFGPQTALSLLIVERAIQLAFLYLVSRRWFARMRAPESSIDTLGIVLLFAYGFAWWAIFLVPLIAQTVPMDRGMQALLLVVLIPSVILWLRYYFYFVPIILRVRSPWHIARIAASFSAQDRWLALRTCVAPMALTSLLSALANAGSPDGSDAVFTFLTAACAPIFWVGSTYLSLAAALVLMAEPTWRQLGLEPYRQARLTTIAMHGPALLTKLLRPKQGLKILVLSLLIWAANLIRLGFTPPPATITVQEITIQESTVTLRARFADSASNFRGVQPLSFALAGEKRTTIAPFPTSLTLVPTESETRDNAAAKRDRNPRLSLYAIESSDPELTIDLRFPTTRSGEALRSLEDLYLWYRYVKVLKLDMKSARILPPAAGVTAENASNSRGENQAGEPTGPAATAAAPAPAAH